VSDSQTLARVDALDAVEAADRQLHALAVATTLAVLAEARRAGLELPDHAPTQLAQAVAARLRDPTRLALKRLAWDGYMRGRTAEIADQAEIPTRPNAVAPREPTP